ncbi:transposase family protein [Leptospira interrogans serovar Szwajizak]|uniref:transposase family protein n=1 Tax=Leptospira interrogans TaxID=173 RepID=UPI003CF74D39
MAEALFLSLDSMNTLPANEISDLKRKLKKFKKLKYVIIDGTERPIRRPTNKDLQKEFYSGKKKKHTIKNLILTNKDKVILFLSNTMITLRFLKMWHASLTLVLKELKRHQKN